jgi:hypothetical protein
VETDRPRITGLRKHFSRMSREARVDLTSGPVDLRALGRTAAGERVWREFLFGCRSIQASAGGGDAHPPTPSVARPQTISSPLQSAEEPALSGLLAEARVTEPNCRLSGRQRSPAQIVRRLFVKLAIMASVRIADARYERQIFRTVRLPPGIWRLHRQPWTILSRRLQRRIDDYRRPR